MPLSQVPAVHGAYPSYVSSYRHAAGNPPLPKKRPQESSAWQPFADQDPFLSLIGSGEDDAADVSQRKALEEPRAEPAVWDKSLDRPLLPEG
jgi:hypothetical protein